MAGATGSPAVQVSGKDELVMIHVEARQLALAFVRAHAEGDADSLVTLWSRVDELDPEAREALILAFSRLVIDFGCAAGGGDQFTNRLVAEQAEVRMLMAEGFPGSGSSS